MPAKTTTSRQRRSRKSAAKSTSTAQRIAAAVDKQEAKVEPKVTPTPKPVVVKYEVKSAPPQPKLSWEDYKEDIMARVRIHNYETQMLWEDLQKGYNYLLPFGKKAYNFVASLSAK